MDQLPDGWQQDGELNASTQPAADKRGRVSMYPLGAYYGGQFCWMAYQKNAQLSGIVATQAEGIFAVEGALAMPEAAFIRQAAQKIMIRIADLQAELIEMGCGNDINGYAEGHAKGFADALSAMQRFAETAGVKQVAA